MRANSASIDAPAAAFWSAIVVCLAVLPRKIRPNAQTIKASNTAKKKPPSSSDQSPVSNPSRRRPSAVKATATERNMWMPLCGSTMFDLSTPNALWLLQMSNIGRQLLLTCTGLSRYFNDLIRHPTSICGVWL
jgi:hypothetical protein